MALDSYFVQLMSVYQDAYKALQKRLTEQELRGLSTFHTQALIEDVDQIIGQLRQYHSDWLGYVMPRGYQEGSDSAVNKLTKVYGMPEIDVSFGAVHQDAVNVLIRDTFQSVAAATEYMENGLKDALRAAAKEEYQLGVITGETRRQMTKGLMGKLNKKGFTAYYDERGRYIPLKEYADTLLEENWVGFVDAAGRRWDLENYSEMLSRTKVTEATSRGTENRLTSNGLDLVIITDHGAEDWCRFYANRIFSINGATPGYPLLSEAPNGGTPFHPRCKCREAPIVEKFESDEVLKYGKGLDKQYLGLNTEKGYADQAKLRKLEKSVPGVRSSGKKSTGSGKKLPQNIKLPGINKTAQKSIIGGLETALDHGLNTGTECLLTFDANSGKILYNKVDGSHNRVVFPNQLVDLIRNADDNSIVMIHNHPSSSSFSTDDIANLRFNSLQSLAVVGHNKNIYYITKTADTGLVDANILISDYRYEFDKHYDYYRDKVMSGEMTQDEAWREHSDKIIEYVAKNNKLEYWRWFTDEK